MVVECIRIIEMVWVALGVIKCYQVCYVLTCGMECIRSK